MKTTTTACLFFLAFPAFSQELVQTTEGPVQGLLTSNTWSYKSIPFAAPPVGPLRWQPPAPPSLHDEILDATAWGPVCPQRSSDSTIGQEDCLQLNIWSPSATGLKPVIFWIHGGAFLQGGASFTQAGARIYDAQRLAEATGAVVVTTNYRLGPLGFLALPALSSDQGSSGNLGTLDQIAALDWTRRNIRSFGGDPDRVLIAGESAGGVSVCALLTAPQARGLFHSAAIQSGGCIAKPLDSAESYGQSYAASLACDPNDAACLRSKSPEELLAVLPGAFNISTSSSDFSPVIDGIVQPALPINTIARGEHAHVPVIVGSNSDETGRAAPPIRTEAEYIAFVRQMFPTRLLSALVLSQYPASDYPSPRAAFVALTSDSRFICPSRRVSAALRSAQAEPVFRYFFTHIPDNASGALREAGVWHGLDVLYLFQQLDQLFGYQPGPADAEVAKAFSSYWSTLAASGTPNSAAAPFLWPQSDDADSYLDLNNPLQAAQGVRTRQCDFWDRLVGLLQ